MSTRTFADRRSLEGAKPGIVVVDGLLALVWVLEIIDSASFHALNQLGIITRNIGSLLYILTAPWLYFGFPHLISNPVPFLILGLLTWLVGPGRWLTVTLITTVTSGLTVWLVAPSSTITLGASGLVLGYLAYLLMRSLFTRNIWEITLSVAVFFFYDSTLLGMLPGASGVSWQGHLGRAIGGFIAAKFLHGNGSVTQRVRPRHRWHSLLALPSVCWPC